jgi:hypothetical protein
MPDYFHVIGSVVSWAIVAWFAAVFAAVAFGVLTGKIVTRGLLRVRGERGLHFHRLQLFGSTLAFVVYYLGMVVAHPHAMPDLSPFALALFAGSHAGFFGGKLFNH